MTDDIDKPPDNHGTDATLVQIYYAYTEALSATENKRQIYSQIYLSLSIAVITAYYSFNNLPRPLVAAILLIISITWFFGISSYRTLAQAKFKVLHEMEKKLPYAPFTTEWEHVKRRRLRLRITDAERIVPIAVTAFALYLLVLQ